jgi:hypothetical protein
MLLSCVTIPCFGENESCTVAFWCLISIGGVIGTFGAFGMKYLKQQQRAEHHAQCHQQPQVVYVPVPANQSYGTSGMTYAAGTPAGQLLQQNPLSPPPLSPEYETAPIGAKLDP